MQKKICDAHLSTHTCNALTQAGFLTVEDVKNKTDIELLSIKGMGRTGLLEIYNILLDRDYVSNRTMNALKCGGLSTIEEVKNKTDIELLAFKGFGQSCLAEIYKIFPDRVRPDKKCKKGRIQDKERAEDIAKMRLDNHTLQQIADKYGISRQRVYQVLQNMG